MKIQRAIISVSDKSGVVDFARQLVDRYAVEVISTGGTAKTLEQNGVTVRSISAYTGFPEIMDGRVKTLHPRVHGGLLAVRDNPSHVQQMTANQIQPIDMVVVNLYPFRETIAKPEVSVAEAIENIDIGGPAMLRSAAKNHNFVTVIVDPADYGVVLAEIEENKEVSLETRKRLAAKAFRHTADYDTAIANYLAKVYRQ
jgi:phosphoribosylaminoimidazolecarboxamide formyltransferase / IMP cyclohydrolase